MGEIKKLKSLDYVVRRDEAMRIFFVIFDYDLH